MNYHQMKDRTFVIIGIIADVFSLVFIIGFIGQGNVRHVEIFWSEKVEQTVAFRDIDGKVKLVGILGWVSP